MGGGGESPQKQMHGKTFGSLTIPWKRVAKPEPGAKVFWFLRAMPVEPKTIRAFEALRMAVRWWRNSMRRRMSCW